MRVSIGRRAAVGIALLGSLGLVVNSRAALGESTAPRRLQPAEMRYLGSFRLPQSFNWGARGASYRPSGDGGRGSLLVTGHDQKTGEWAEVGIPEFGTGSYESLPEAPLVSPFVEYDADLIEENTASEHSRSGGVECLPARSQEIPERCYWNVTWWYNVAGTDYKAVGMSEPDGSNAQGMWHVGPNRQDFHGSRHGGYMFSVPQGYADEALGGRSVIVGMHREGGAFGASQGPTLFAFRPWDGDAPPPEANLDGQALVYYRQKFPECAGPNVGDPENCDFPEYRACDKWEGGAFLEGNGARAVVLSGVKALGSNGYGPGKPGDCSANQGYHCDPFEARLIFYDVAELAAAAAGRLKPWEVVPYASWNPKELLQTPCPEMGGLAVDSQRARLFVIEKKHGRSNSSVVHVFGLPSDPPADAARTSPP